MRRAYPSGCDPGISEPAIFTDQNMQALGLIWGEVDSRAPDYRECCVRAEAPKHPGADLVLRVWQERVAAGEFLVGRDVPSRMLSHVLHNLAVYEPVEGARDIRVRLAGTAFYRRFGRDVTGARFSELFDPPAFARNRDLLIETIQSGNPTVLAIERAQGSRVPMRYECLLLPVLAPDRAAHWVLAGRVFHDGPR